MAGKFNFQRCSATQTLRRNFAGRVIAEVSEAVSVHRKYCRKSRFGYHGMKPAGSTNGKSAMKLSSRQPSSKSLPAKRILGQYFLDFGQRDFTYKTCRACGLVYAAGLDEDEKVHAKYHKNRLSGIAFQGWQHERVVRKVDNKGTRIILVLPDDSLQHFRKVEEVSSMLECDLGLPKNWLLNGRCKTYLYISAKKVVGCVMVEPLREAFAVLHLFTNQGAEPPVPEISVSSKSIQSDGMALSGETEILAVDDRAGLCAAKLEAEQPIPEVSASERGSVSESRSGSALGDWASDMPGLSRCSNSEASSSKQGPDTRLPAVNSSASSKQAGLHENHGGGKERSRLLVHGQVTFVRQGGKRVVGNSRPRNESVDRSSYVCEATPSPASCGIRAMWVHSSEQRKGVATRLLDTVRSSFVYGSNLARSACAFSQPTPDGRAFAAAYCHTESFLVYQDKISV